MELRGHFHILGIWPWVELVVELVVEIKVKYPKYGKVLVPLQTILLTTISPEGEVNSGQAKVRRFLGIVWTTASFIAQICSSKSVLKRDAILAPVAKQYK